MRTRYPTFALIRVARLEMTPVAVLSASRIPGAALMPFIVDDEFHVFARERSLPPCALSFLMLAGPWSARESRSGFVPNSMLADFSDDFAQAEGTLCSAGILKRVKAGVRIVEGHGLTVVNAKDVSRDTERERAEAEERREAWRLKKQGQRASKRAAKHERIAAGVPGVSPKETIDVPRENPGHPKKPQVKASHVPGDITGTSPGTAKTSASDYQDPDQNLSAGVNQSRVNPIDARVREAPSPGTLAVVAAGCSKKLKRVVTEAEACRAIAEWERRAEAAGEVIHDPEKYHPACIRREADLEAIIAAPLPAPPPEWLVPAPVSGPGVHAFVPDANPFVDACAHPGCGVKQSNARHVKQEAGTG